MNEIVPIAATPAAPPAPGATDVVAAFLRALKPTTARARDQDLRDFARFAGGTVREAVAWLTMASHGRANHIAYCYRGHLEARNLAPATVARRLASLRAVVALARAWGSIDWALDVPAPRVEGYRDTRGPGDDGWDAVRRTAAAEAATGDPRAARDRAILLVAHDLGLRVGELVGLDLEHIERGRDGLPASLWILGKGRTARERLSLPVAAAEALDAWLRARGEHPGAAFVRCDRRRPGAESGRLTARSVERMAAAIGRRAGLARPLRPHGLRHHAITRALDLTGGDVRRVKAFSRHARVETVMRYDDARRDDAGAIASLVGE